MTTHTRTITTDDLTGEEGAITRRFAIDGRGYEIDLADNTWIQFKATIGDILEKARFAGPAIIGKGPQRLDYVKNGEAAAVRVWARTQGIEVKTRGRIPADITHAYRSHLKATS